ncbi:hypothetical protein FD975_03600 [Polynucleobacter sp. AP-Jannik-300A-C4]|uniref:hypothetical protein n=1 Tax=Polynucleobacter sp. AP-Jannik-300A-C4 TaxID=2576928 RepID=UPI001BFD4E1C|nr:hypothetical protein [Polynucleobacter sp. AP-Jannik-300A-C4]QWE23304.1 hypothetical protein FD975_03600 [Polynucleobacter sp. AP-Jannik-300A-C4]
MSENDNKKGFAGLSSLESKVEPVHSKEVPDQEKNETNLEEPHSQAVRTEPPPISTVVPKYTYSPEMEFVKKYWIWLLLGIFLIYIFASQDSKKTTSTSYSSGSYTPAPAYTAPSFSSELVESKPLYGANNVLTASEIYYCKAEELRIESNKTTVDRYDDFSLTRFNQTVQDYNSRCAQYRYKDAAMNSANNALESNRYSIEAQGRARM